MQQVLLKGSFRKTRLRIAAEQSTPPFIPVHGARDVEGLILAAHLCGSRERAAFGAGTCQSQEESDECQSLIMTCENRFCIHLIDSSQSAHCVQPKGFPSFLLEEMTGPATHPEAKMAALCSCLVYYSLQ